MSVDISRFETRLHRLLLASVGAPYKFGGRGMSGIDCSSVLMRAIRESTRLKVSQLPWMTADQMARGVRDVTAAPVASSAAERCQLAFFDWDEDGIYEHAAARLLDATWIWASTSAGKVIRVDPKLPAIWDRQWREIDGALDGPLSTIRQVNWIALATVR